MIAADAQPGSNREKITLFEMGIYPNSMPERKFAVSLPRYAEVTEIVPSPQGDRVAWGLVFHRQPTFRKFLARYFPALKKGLSAELDVSLWISRLDGKEMREIGSQSAGTEADHKPAPHDFRWIDGGRRLRFFYKEAPYVLAPE
ncbi:MAG TPA: hypothetical protein VFB38_26095 [Chthonomonadaceae bacterium]|nr:hypothetical protein [Chthonomonadaceae bacterium]